MEQNPVKDGRTKLEAWFVFVEKVLQENAVVMADVLVNMERKEEAETTKVGSSV